MVGSYKQLKVFEDRIDAERFASLMKDRLNETINMNIWKYIKAEPFFKEYLPQIKSHKFKIRGLNSRDNPTDFTKEEKKEIKAALKKLFKDLTD